jgi:general secretion pathway protein L
MSLTFSRLSSGSLTSGWADRLRRFGRWWLGELLALFPERTAAWLVGGGRVSLAVAGEGDRIALHLLDDRRQIVASHMIVEAHHVPAAIEEFLATHGLSPDEVPIGMRLAADRIFCRKLILPLEAEGSLETIVVQDLVGKTPFRLPAIHHDHVAVRTAGSGKLVVWQWVARRDLVAETAARLGLEAERLAFVDAVSGPDHGAPPPRIALRDESGGATWTRTAAVALAGGLVVLGLAAGAGRYWRQQAAIDALDLQVTAAKARAQQVRAAIDRLEQKQGVLLQLRARKADRPGLLDAWEEATRILPSHSWLTELRLTETANGKDQQIVMTGYSQAATSLVGLLDQSPLLADTSLTAPVALDPVEQRERFALQARLQQPTKRTSR